MPLRASDVDLVPRSSGRTLACPVRSTGSATSIGVGADLLALVAIAAGALAATALGDSACIVLPRHRLHMVGIETGRLATKVIECRTVGKSFSGKLISNAVHVTRPAAYGRYAITSHLRAGP
jgi:hypothetical protein